MDRPLPPEWIELADAGVVLRRHRLDDVDALHAVIEESRDHVRPFMPWADQPREGTAEFVAKAVAGWDAAVEFNYLVTRPADERSGESEEIIGGTGFGPRGGPPMVFEIGYWLRPDATGRGVMTAVAGRLAEISMTYDEVERVEIRCDEANIRSAGVPRRLGFALDRLVDTPVTSPGELGRHMVWVRDRQRSTAPVARGP